MTQSVFDVTCGDKVFLLAATRFGRENSSQIAKIQMKLAYTFGKTFSCYRVRTRQVFVIMTIERSITARVSLVVREVPPSAYIHDPPTDSTPGKSA